MRRMRMGGVPIPTGEVRSTTMTCTRSGHDELLAQTTRTDYCPGVKDSQGSELPPSTRGRRTRAYFDGWGALHSLTLGFAPT